MAKLDLQAVKAVVGDTPHMHLAQAERLTDFIAEKGIREVLELGFAHGVSTCYMAAALSHLGGGHILTIDREAARERSPNIEQLLEQLGERDRVTVSYEPSSYTWRLMKMLEEDPRPRFDFCYLDGAHTWAVDGFAFLLVDRLLKPGGWIIFDDLNWSHDRSPMLANSELLNEIPAEERSTPQVRKVYELLVKPHPAYHNFMEDHGWAYAQKREDATHGVREKEVVVERVVEVEKEYLGLGGLLMRIAKRLQRPGGRAAPAR